MIELLNITLAFGNRTLVEGASTRFERGTMTALVGRNGTGKSTLLRAIARLGECRLGEIHIEGRSIHEMSAVELARKVAFVNTERIDVEALTAYDLVAIGRAPYTNWMGQLTERDKAQVEHALQVTGVSHLAKRNVETLSDGECQRVMIARALAQDTPIILLDEPTAFLDLPNRYELCSLLRRLAKEENKLVIFSTHELDIALGLSDSVALIDTPQLRHMPTNEMIYSGYIEQLFNGEQLTFDPATCSMRLQQR